MASNITPIVQILMDLGVPMYSAKILQHLHTHGESTQKEIQADMKMTQPTVSTGSKDLKKRGWVSSTFRLTRKKGRPVHCYHLDVPLESIVIQIELQYKDSIKTLRKLLRN